MSCDERVRIGKLGDDISTGFEVPSEDFPIVSVIIDNGNGEPI
jgi:hypothetical protein